MEITYIITMEKNNMHWRMIGTELIQKENEPMPITLTASVYGMLQDATDTTEKYLKDVLGDRLTEYENLIKDNINSQKDKMGITNE